jgi:hypothetical protein
MSIHKRETYRQIFRKLQILPLAAQYILEVLCFIEEYQGDLQQNFAIHGHNYGCIDYRSALRNIAEER